VIESGTKGGKSMMEGALRRAARLPLAPIAGAMLAAATAFFCYAMPPRVLAGLLGGVGVAGPVGNGGRTAFVLAFAALAGLLGWAAVAIAGRGARPSKAEDDAAAPRVTGSAHPPGTIEGAPPPLAAPRGDGQKDAPVRRPIFADRDPSPEASPPRQQAEATPQPARQEPAAEAAVTPADPATPSVRAAPLAKAAPEERTIAALMARLERGLDGRDGDLPPPPTAEQIAALHDPVRGSEDTLRTAIEALQRISTRPR
jgi:hypothetical protein